MLMPFIDVVRYLCFSVKATAQGKHKNKKSSLFSLLFFFFSYPKMCESYNDQKLKEFLGAVLQAYGIQEATQSSLDLYANAAKDCTLATF